MHKTDFSSDHHVHKEHSYKDTKIPSTKGHLCHRVIIVTDRQSHKPVSSKLYLVLKMIITSSNDYQQDRAVGSMRKYLVYKVLPSICPLVNHLQWDLSMREYKIHKIILFREIIMIR